MSRVRGAALVALVGLAVAAAGAAYALTRTPDYESAASLTLVPHPEQPADRASLLDSFERSGTIGTYVELIASRDTLRAAGDPGVAVSAREVPRSRVVQVATRGERARVRPALGALLAAARRESQRLGDPWVLTVLESPSAPAVAGPGTGMLLAASLALGLLAALCAQIGLRRLMAGSGARAGNGPESAAAALAPVGPAPPPRGSGLALPQPVPDCRT